MKRERPTLFAYQEDGVNAMVEALLHHMYQTSTGESKKGRSFLLYDEMGLGKTMQTWETCKRLKEMGQMHGPLLIVCPSSVTNVWTAGDRQTYFNDTFQVASKDEMELNHNHAVVISYDSLLNMYKYYVNAKVPEGRLTNEQMLKFCEINHKTVSRAKSLRGDSFRLELISICKTIERKITNFHGSYECLNAFMERKWGCIIMDEVQRVKNSASASCRSVAFMNAHFRIALSGTPVVNHGGELVTILKMALNLFDLDWKTIKGNPNGHYCTQVLRSFTLGRKKADVKELVGILPKREKHLEEVLVDWIDLYQKEQYVRIKEASLSALEDVQNLVKLPNESSWEFNQRKLSKNRHFMTKLQRMRQVCLHPDLPFLMDEVELKEPREWNPFVHATFHPWIRSNVFTLLCCLKRCGRFYDQRLRFVKHYVRAESRLILPSPKMMKLIPYLKEKVVIFSSYRKFLTKLVRPWLTQLGLKSAVFCGGSKLDQQKALKAFETDEEVRFLLVVKGAGAEGLNLQKSSHICFIMDPHFNNATDEQASQRIDRIGQEHEVIVRKLFMMGSIDEVMRQMQKRKQQNADAWLNKEPTTTNVRALEAQGLFLKEFDTVH